jgi:hypothetical protein
MRAVLVIIADDSNVHGDLAAPGLGALVDRSLYRRSSVLAALARLKNEGWIETVRRRSPNGPETFRIPGFSDPDWAPVTDGQEVQGLDLSEVQSLDVTEDREVQAVDLSEVQAVDLSVQSVDLSNEAKVQSTATESQCFGPLDGSLLSSLDGFKENGSTAVDAQFVDFWSRWPRRNGKKIGRADAEKRWGKLTCPERTEALIGATHYASASASGLAGAMDAHRWLTHRSWVDWQTPARADRPLNGNRPLTGADAGMEILRRRGAVR